MEDNNNDVGLGYFYALCIVCLIIFFIVLFSRC